MKKLICADGRELKFSAIESLRLIPLRDFIGDNLPTHIKCYPKGEKFKLHFWQKKKAYEDNMFVFYWGVAEYLTNAEYVVENLKSGDYGINVAWEGYFIQDDLVSRAAQVEYNKEKDCVRRKPTISIRTKSGDVLYAVFSSNEEAENVIIEFNSME